MKAASVAASSGSASAAAASSGRESNFARRVREQGELKALGPKGSVMQQTLRDKVGEACSSCEERQTASTAAAAAYAERRIARPKENVDTSLEEWGVLLDDDYELDYEASLRLKHQESKRGVLLDDDYEFVEAARLKHQELKQQELKQQVEGSASAAAKSASPPPRGQTCVESRKQKIVGQ